MPRSLKTTTLENFSDYLASEFMKPRSIVSPRDKERFISGRPFVMQELYNLFYKDEFYIVVSGLKERLGTKPLTDLEAELKKLEPRKDKVFVELLKKNLAIDPNGNHIEGQVGSVVVGSRFIRRHMIEVETLESIRERKYCRLKGLTIPPRKTYMKEVNLYWPIYAGETEERIAGSTAVDPLPEGTPGLSVGALATRISNEAAIAACNSIVDLLDEGSGAAIIKIYNGTQPTDPDTAVEGTELSVSVCSDPAFGNAVDANPGGRATASAIADATVADTGDADFFRASATNDGATPLDDHIDGSCGTADANMILNTVSLAAGATLSISSWTVTMPETEA